MNFYVNESMVLSSSSSAGHTNVILMYETHPGNSKVQTEQSVTSNLERHQASAKAHRAAHALAGF